jgi:hypothetical protein
MFFVHALYEANQLNFDKLVPCPPSLSLAIPTGHSRWWSGNSALGQILQATVSPLPYALPLSAERPARSGGGESAEEVISETAV